MAKERYSLIIMVEKILFDLNDEPINLGPVRNVCYMVPGEHTTLKKAKLAAEKLATPQILKDGKKQESSLPGESQLPSKDSDNRQHRSGDGSRI